jgi:hypothetical protein
MCLPLLRMREQPRKDRLELTTVVRARFGQKHVREECTKCVESSGGSCLTYTECFFCQPSERTKAKFREGSLQANAGTY